MNNFSLNEKKLFVSKSAINFSIQLKPNFEKIADCQWYIITEQFGSFIISI